MPAVHDDRSRAEGFGAAAERYDRSRPSYPPELIDAIDPAGRDVLDVGCGTGIASALLAARGARVLGVEIDARMAEVARAKGIDVEVASFESWDPAGRRFDRVTAAQAWHWVDPVAGAAKAAEVLRPGGRLCLFWNIGRPPADVDGALDEVYAQMAPEAHGVSVQTGYATEGYGKEQDGIRRCPALTDPEVERFPWTRTYTRDQWLDQLPTHSDHAALPPDRLEALLSAVGEVIDRFGGRFEMEYSTLLIHATRR
jgi:SAM-dependent methyltransferase